jgi:DNA-binding MarR family transcriptional regulator
MTDADYHKLYEFRARLRRFLRSSDERIRRAGLTPSHYLLLLGIRADPSRLGPTIGDMAEFLVLKHHTVVELVDRAEGAGLIKRAVDPDDGRVVRLALTASGRQRLERVASVNFQELSRLELLSTALEDVGRT